MDGERVLTAPAPAVGPGDRARPVEMVERLEDKVSHQPLA